MSQQDVLERMALANGATDTRNPREFLATTREPLGDPVKSPPFLHPPRWVVVGTPGDEPPEGRIGFLFGGIEEAWTPEYAWSPNGSSCLTGYWVTQRWMSAHCDCTVRKGLLHIDGEFVHPACGRAVERKHKSDREYVQNVRDIQIGAMSDFDYEGFYPSIPGQDIAHADMGKLVAASYKDSDRKKMEIFRGNDTFRSRADDTPRNIRVGVRSVGKDGRNVSDRYAYTASMSHGGSREVRGGTEITGGRRQWREELKRKNLVEHDNGYFGHKERLRKEKREVSERALNEAWLKTEARMKEDSNCRAILEGDAD